MKVRFHTVLWPVLLFCGMTAGRGYAADDTCGGDCRMKPDTTERSRISGGPADTLAEKTAADSIVPFSRYVADTLQVKGGVLPVIEEVELERALLHTDTAAVKKKREKGVGPYSLLAQQRSPLFRDTLEFSKMSALSFVVPGFGQLYNRQYWKIPVLYGGVGAFAGMTAYANKRYKTYSNRYDAALTAAGGNASDPQVLSMQRKMDNYRRQRTVYLAGTAATYLYFVGDAVMNYKGTVKPPQRATMLSAVFPGAGQIYNKSYWKLPILYGGIAACGYAISFNNRGYQRFKRAYNLMTDGDDSTVDEFNGRYSETVLQNTRDSYRRYRDLSIIIMAGIYILNIVDAHVDAYLKRYDISDDLALKVEPTLQQAPVLSRGSGGGQMMGMSMKLNF